MPRTGPQSAEHRKKISDALKRYNADGGHLAQYRKSGEVHPNFRGGIQPRYYRAKAFARYGKRCNRCRRSHKADGSTLYLVVHHRDDNRRNSDIKNLEVLCMGCHLKHHRSAK